jgi:ABC-2 type transport system ATP-binding protein
VLRDISLWDRRDSAIRTLSGGMKRRVMIAKALAHEPSILFLDEPTAGVDVELRRDMWRLVRTLRDAGVTIILTTHYIEEAEELADRIGVINKGALILVEEKDVLMRKLGKKQLILTLREPIDALPDSLAGYALQLSPDKHEMTYTYDAQSESAGVRPLFQALDATGLAYKDVQTKVSSLEEIFVDIVRAGS